MGGGPSLSSRPVFEKSNTELTNGLRSNFRASLEDSQSLSRVSTAGSAADGAPTQSNGYAWVRQEGNTIFVPDPALSESGLAEERSQYDITVKLFFLPTTDISKVGSHTEDAIALVLKELQVPSIDLLIVSFPGVSFDADDEELEEVDGQDLDSAELEQMLPTWKALEEYHKKGVIRQIGLSEFGTERLKKFLPRTGVRPSVDQINVRDCCVVPKSLILYARSEKIELLTHNDCTDILPKGTIRELIASLTSESNASESPEGELLAGLKGEIEPQWVVKYTAVVNDRKVIENKGYFAMAETSA